MEKLELAFAGRDATLERKRCNGLAEELPRFCGRDATADVFVANLILFPINELSAKRERCNALPCAARKSLFCWVFLLIPVGNNAGERERCNGGIDFDRGESPSIASASVVSECSRDAAATAIEKSRRR